jgi:glycosyltransferase involved in cell wall biosynthesis
VFPSETDAYGNVPQEAMASGAPAIVTNMGGPRFFVSSGENGFIANSPDEFVSYAIKLIDDPALLDRMKRDSLAFAATRSWDSVFETVYDAYRSAKLHLDEVKARRPRGKRRGRFTRIGYIAEHPNRD